jgi:Zn-finger nucleic acid-binding protein
MSREREEPGEGEERGPIDCPKCREPMRSERVGCVTVDRCVGCGGLWLDALEKERLLEHKGAARHADAGSRAQAGRMDRKVKILCPRDHSTMIHMVDASQPHVGFESCTVCGGVFLDAGELTDLSEVSLRERVRMVFR